MEQPPYKITSLAELRQRIAYLESIKDQQEEVLRKNIHEVYKSLQPAELLKSAISNIRNDEEIGKNAASLVGNIGIDLLAGKIFDKNDSLGGKLKSMAASELVRLVYNKYQDKIHAAVGTAAGKLMDFLSFSEKKKKEEE